MHIDQLEYDQMVNDILPAMREVNEKVSKTTRDIEFRSALNWSLDVIFDILKNFDSDSAYFELKHIYNDSVTYIELYDKKHPQSLNPFTILHDLTVSVIEYIFGETTGFTCGWDEYF